ncbi:MAG: ABC transporter substrate-binding protein, partial [Caldilineaceae bacterium]|nr:ABC transporter substrate-binding protein [Caldilineaceae bacterium]
MKHRSIFWFTLLMLVSLAGASCAPAAPSGTESAPAAEEQAAAEAPSSGLGDLPRNETLIADILTGRVGSP